MTRMIALFGCLAGMVITAYAGWGLIGASFASFLIGSMLSIAAELHDHIETLK